MRRGYDRSSRGHSFYKRKNIKKEESYSAFDIPEERRSFSSSSSSSRSFSREDSYSYKSSASSSMSRSNSYSSASKGSRSSYSGSYTSAYSSRESSIYESFDSRDSDRSRSSYSFSRKPSREESISWIWESDLRSPKSEKRSEKRRHYTRY
ncbi:MAG: hypothetical protein ACRDCB_12935 [Clostridium sp.]|uniref:hypothetical protein n=1 Tax=Clostridium sp. LY3-2 TaxID=2942482 RepID=UPI002152A753|nr:hypothetical protein [Clostridium sp. LY3-2]MCR6515972.1 hypothetical protein [Clostridium sp. LY3-2]